jgi:phosphatidylserine/phosphatidylglycerophosphate/cardiolipin synthase-like enzyme
MHDKYLIADDWGYILGGRNTDNRFLGYYRENYNEDRDLLVYETKPGQGSSFQALEAYFHEIWNQPCCKEFEAEGGAGGLEKCCERVKERYPEAFDRIYSKEDWEKATMETRGIELWTNPTEPENKEPVVWERMIAAIEGEKDILVQTPYMICSRKMYEDLRSVCEKGARVDIVINAVESGTNPFGCTDYLNQKKKICQTGVHIYEYLGDQAQHTKSLAVGEELSIIGSCNFDMRSVYLNTEMMLAVDCPELNASIREQARPLKEKSRHMSPDGRTEDGQNYEPREQDMAKRAVYALLRIVISPFRHVL